MKMTVYVICQLMIQKTMNIKTVYSYYWRKYSTGTANIIKGKLLPPSTYGGRHLVTMLPGKRIPILRIYL